MNREIKFRAWNNNSNKMYYDSEVKYRTDLCILLEGDLQTIYIDGSGSYEVDGADEEYEIMQYIGIKDKNGKEIYEGDILKYPGDRFCVVVFNTVFSIFQRKWFGEALKFKSNSNFDSTIFGLNTGLIAEVIGNIYENPKLLRS